MQVSFLMTGEGEGEAERCQVPWSGKAYETLSHEIQKGELSLSTTLPAIINRLIQTPYNLVKTRNTALMHIYVR